MPPVNKKSMPTFPRGKSKVKVGPVWRGPCDPGPNGGVTQSMLSNFLVCRERFRLRYVEGLRSADAFNARMEFGNLWHACEEALAANRDWREGLDAYVQVVAAKYPLDRALVDKWQMACRTQFPVYVDYWAKHPDVEERTPFLQEAVFDVPYSLPSGRTVRLRGKFDAVDLIGKGKSAGVYLQENKTKSDIDEQKLRRQLQFDLQSMTYLVALQKFFETPPGLGNFSSKQVKGIRYNVCRRPLSGGKGSIKQGEGTQGSKCSKCKASGRIKHTASDDTICPKCNGRGRIGGNPPETDEHFWNRLKQYFIDEPEAFFMRWRVEVTPPEIRQFERRFLQPILEQLCDWYEWVAGNHNPFHNETNYKDGRRIHSSIHWQHPFGVYNSMNEGGSTDYDNVLATGNTVGLVRRESLFEELK